MTEPNVILVDEYDNEIGMMPKLEAHQKGVLHRAISVFIFDLEGNWLLQQRAANKYHSANLWTNACCSHPIPGEKIEDAAHRRLIEEMGLECSLIKVLSFIYRAELEHGLIEHEFDHVFIGFSSASPLLNKSEVASSKLVSFEALDDAIQKHPENYTEWFKLIYKKVHLHLALSKNYIKN